MPQDAQSGTALEGRGQNGSQRGPELNLWHTYLNDWQPPI